LTKVCIKRQSQRDRYTRDTDQDGGLNMEILIYTDNGYNVEITNTLQPYAENKKYIKFDTREDMLDFVTRLVLGMED
jgi:hypothetical protein